MTKPKNFFQNLMRPFKFGSSRGDQSDEALERIAAQEQKQFSYEILVSATKEFHVTHKLGEGGFGPVYKNLIDEIVWIKISFANQSQVLFVILYSHGGLVTRKDAYDKGKLDDGREIAVKKLSHTSHQGKKEFTNEAKLLARVQHRNVVNLLGYCVHGTEKLLVYEYVANESLDKFLFSTKSNKREQLDWKRRYDIITGIARGLLYLHEDSHHCIIHRDIKASNILLDDKWSPKIADFGMARLFPEDQTHVNTRVAGTNGYMAPEYVMHGHLSAKADVFSFGVLVLELISAQRNSTFNQQVDAQNLLEWTYKLHKKERSLEIMDPTLASTAVVEQVKTCIHIGLLCTQGDPQLRPTMRRVVVILSRKPGVLEEPTRPGVPGSRYRRSRRPPGMSSTAGSSGDSDSRTYDTSLNTNTATASASTSALTATASTSASTSALTSTASASASTATRSSGIDRHGASASTSTHRSGIDRHGKRPMQS